MNWGAGSLVLPIHQNAVNYNSNLSFPHSLTMALNHCEGGGRAAGKVEAEAGNWQLPCGAAAALMSSNGAGDPSSAQPSGTDTSCNGRLAAGARHRLANASALLGCW